MQKGKSWNKMEKEEINKRCKIIFFINGIILFSIFFFIIKLDVTGLSYYTGVIAGLLLAALMNYVFNYLKNKK